MGTGKTENALVVAYINGHQCHLLPKASDKFSTKYPDQPNPYNIDAVGLDKVFDFKFFNIEKFSYWRRDYFRSFPI